jgi:hypothetical protein
MLYCSKQVQVVSLIMLYCSKQVQIVSLITYMEDMHEF